jgi:hypothetical protein
LNNLYSTFIYSFIDQFVFFVVSFWLLKK